MALPNISVNISNVSVINDSGFLNDVARAGAYTYTCVNETYSVNTGLLSFLNMITLGAMLYLHRKGRLDLYDRGVNILLLVNVFAFFANFFILLGFKFYPARG